jgi:ABC-type uncharacterized transport system permease subunit
MLMDIAISACLVCFAGMMSGKKRVVFVTGLCARVCMSTTQRQISTFTKTDQTLAGLTLGLLSLDPVVLRIAASSPEDKVKAARGRVFSTKKNNLAVAHNNVAFFLLLLLLLLCCEARKILPLLRRKHLLLVTLLIANAGAMEAYVLLFLTC